MRYRLTSAFIVLCGVAFAQGTGIISTFGGNGTQGFSGDGGLATAASLNQPPFVTFDGAGNLYIADEFNNRIRKVDKSGIITTVAGNGAAGFAGDGGPAINAVLNRPIGVNFDPAGNLYIADTVNQRIRKVDTSGTITTFAGSGALGFGGDGGQATAASFYNPVRTVADALGNVYVADQSEHRIRKINAAGIISTLAGNGVGTPATGAYSGDGGPATSASLNNPTAVAVDAAGNVYFSDQFNHRIRKVTISTGIITTIAGIGTAGFSGDGGPAVGASLNFPGGMVLDPAGNIYFDDDANHRVRRIDTSGIITTVAGNGSVGFSGDGGPATSAQLNGEFGVALDASGNLYIADILNNRIRKVTAARTPFLTSASITNAASFVSGATAGGIVTIFGTGLSNGVNGIVGITKLPIPTTMAGTSVTVGGVPAPLFNVININGTEQINLQIPFEVAGQTSVPVVVNNGTASNAAVLAQVLPAQPGIFTIGANAGAILHGADNSVVTATHPAAKGEVVVVFVTGLGAVDPPVATGAQSPASPLSHSVFTPSVTIGGVGAPVSFSGLAPGFAGLFQINVQVPASVASGNLDMIVTANGVASNTAKVMVQ